MDQASIAGEDIPASYNNQADALKTLPFLLSSAFMDIRTAVKPKRAVYPVSIENTSGQWEAARMPKDCRQIISGGIRAVTPSGPVPANAYRFYGDRQIWLPPGEYLIEYEAFPTSVPASARDTDTIDEDPDVIHAAIYYAAAHLIRQDSPFDFQALMNEYEERKNALRPAPVAEIVPIPDVYGF